jgi:hypothetical protein
MDTKIIDLICRQIYRQYKEFSGARPSSSNLPNGNSILVFHTNMKTADGKSMDRDLRVTVDAKGRILKTTTSR